MTTARYYYIEDMDKKSIVIREIEGTMHYGVLRQEIEGTPVFYEEEELEMLSKTPVSAVTKLRTDLEAKRKEMLSEVKKLGRKIEDLKHWRQKGYKIHVLRNRDD